jgi:hypothetical protein
MMLQFDHLELKATRNYLFYKLLCTYQIWEGTSTSSLHENGKSTRVKIIYDSPLVD